MSSLQRPRPVRAPRWPAGLVPWRQAVARVLEELCRRSNLGIEIIGARSASGDGGDTLRFAVGGGGGSSDSVHGIHPFYIYPDGRIHAGTVGVTIPTLADEPIGEDGAALTLVGSGYVYIEAKFALVFGATFFLESATLTTLKIVGSTEPKVDAQSSTELTTHRLIAHILDGLVLREQPTYTSLSLVVCDNSTGADGGQACQAIWTPA